MKEAIGGVSLFQIVIVFIILFTGYVCLSINYSKAYSIKNELLTVIKNQGGVCTSTNPGNICYNFTSLVADYLTEMNYHASGYCKDDEIGFKKDGTQQDSGKKAAFCVAGIRLGNNSELANALYYKVTVFFQLDLPIVNSIFNFNVSGETTRISSPNECGYGYSPCWCDTNRVCDFLKDDVK